MISKPWNIHCVKSVHIRSFSGPHFPAFELNTKDTEYLSIFCQNAGKCGPEKLRNGHFSRSDTEWNWWISCTFSLGKIPKFRLISCCGNFVEAPSFRRVSGQSRNFGISSSSSFNNLFWNQFIFENIHRKKINNFSLIFCCRKELISEACLEPN